MKNNKTVKRDRLFKTSLESLSEIWDTANLNEYQCSLLYTAMQSIIELLDDLKEDNDEDSI